MQTSDKRLISRFLRYVSIDTKGNPDNEAIPTTEGQITLANILAEELRQMGAADIFLADAGTLYARIPATAGCEKQPAIGFIAHMDTSYEAPGANIRPQIIRYEGGSIVLNAEKNIVMTPEKFPELSRHTGEDIIFTDGTTLLGADDKSGVAAIMEMAETVLSNPEIAHGPLCIAFTPDEEIGRGTERFDLERFGAAFAYTFDGGELGELEWENFNAAKAAVRFSGVGVHPGTAKGKMVNAIRCAAHFIGLLEALPAPENTEKREGFLHPIEVSGSVTEASCTVLIRDHDAKAFARKKVQLQELVQQTEKAFPGSACGMVITDSYVNMRPFIEKAPKVLELVREAYRRAGLTPIERPIRGGTDGAMLSASGLPCPNVFAGGLNFHSVYEFLPVPNLLKARDVALEIAKLSAA